MWLTLAVVALEVACARGVVAVLGDHDIIGPSVYSTNLLTLLAIAAGTDHAIFRSAGSARHDGGSGTGVLHRLPGTAYAGGLTIIGRDQHRRGTRLTPRAINAP